MSFLLWENIRHSSYTTEEIHKNMRVTKEMREENAGKRMSVLFKIIAFK